MDDRATTPKSHHVAALALVGAWAAIVATACVVPSIGIGDSAAPAESSGDTGSDDGSDGAADSGRSLLGCNIKNVGDPSDCPGNCNTAIEGAEGIYQCTVTCDATTQDCGEGYYCQIFADGGTACLGDCSNGSPCESGDACDDVLSVCLPDAKTQSSGGSSSGGDGPEEVSVVCDFAVVKDVHDCDEDCDEPVYTGEGLYVCTTSCDVDLQDCPGPKYRCESVNDGTAACFLDCSDGNACPGDDYACDQDLELCIPVR